MNDDLAAESASAIDTRSRWGRVRFGARRLPALAVAAPIGLLLALGIAGIAVAAGGAGPVIGRAV